MEKYILAIDQGTTSTRAILFDHESHVVAIAQKEITTYYPKNGWVEQNANDIWASVVGVIFEVVTKAGCTLDDVAAIGITNQRETTVVWDKKTGVPIYFAIVWHSRQSNYVCEKIKEDNMEEYIKETTGLANDPYFSATKIRFILDNVEGAQERAENGELAFGTIESYLIFKMSKHHIHVSDISNVSRTMLLNLKTLDYDEKLLDYFNIPECMLPEICDNSQMFDVTDDSIFGSKILICSAIGDQQAALFAQLCFKSGDVKNTYGTGCFMLMNTEDKCVISKNGLVSCVGWKYNNKVNYVLEGSVFVAGAAIQWLRDGLQFIKESTESEKIANTLTSSEGVYVVPAFTGLGAPYWKPETRGAIFGLTRATTSAHIVRATLESLAYQSYDVLHAMCQDSGLRIKTLKVDGGASRNKTLMQFQSDILNCTVLKAANSESTALGAAYLAGLAIGFWKNEEELISLTQIGETFKPDIDENKRNELIKGWKKAVHAAMEY